jgi:chorismate synthase
MVMLTLADAVLDKFGGDSLAETKANAAAYRERISRAPGAADRDAAGSRDAVTATPHGLSGTDVAGSGGDD